MCKSVDEISRQISDKRRAIYLPARVTLREYRFNGVALADVKGTSCSAMMSVVSAFDTAVC